MLLLSFCLAFAKGDGSSGSSLLLHILLFLVLPPLIRGEVRLGALRRLHRRPPAFRLVELQKYTLLCIYLWLHLQTLQSHLQTVLQNCCVKMTTLHSFPFQASASLSVLKYSFQREIGYIARASEIVATV